MARRRKTKRFSIEDPFAEREAARYERPIPSREALLAFLEQRAEPMTVTAIARALGMRDERDREALRRRLQAMERTGQIVRNRRDAYGIAHKMGLVRGRVTAHPDGFGFLIPEEGGDDLFLAPRQMKTLMHGDRAIVRISGFDRQGRPEGALVEILERANHRVVGRLRQEGGVAFVVPDNRRLVHELLIAPEDLGEAKPGQIVVAEITSYPEDWRQPLAKIVEVLGDHMAPGMEIDVAARSYQLPTEFPPAVLAEADRFGGEVSRADAAGRRDLRQLPLVTIDGADARDFDDAVYCERRHSGWRLVVAIADVSSYVKPGSALDQSARERGTSVYFPGRVIPMLPEVLSNGLCSLNPHVDRLCMVCDMVIDREGRIARSTFYQGVMRSAARLTYDTVAAILVDRDAELSARHKTLLPHLRALYGLYRALASARRRRGAIDFETTETRIQFDAQGKIDRIVPLQRNDAHRIIEECMIAANVAAARFLKRHKMPFLYRIHERPDQEKLTDVRSFLSELGLTLGGGDDPTAKHFATLMRKIRDRPDRHLIETVLLRSLKQAQYSPDNVGHFGLALDNYTHFTSPIRRYPDLLVHRAIRHVLERRAVDAFPYDHSQMVTLGEHCSMTERRADEAVRDAVDWLKCEYMLDKVGEVFDGLITGVTSFGIFVELESIYAQGLVHVSSLQNDYYHFDAPKHRLVGERTGQTFRLADPVRVKVVRVDLDERKIDFELVDAASASLSKRRGRSRGRKRR
ncbi:MAG: ribonuclease R [Gammaproteobacteria bacterium]